ncbi:hypothetical protein MJG53_016547 [Ovis ammon polii x Ovis aries]|uniref:Uncharacterized protein n=1 Tax=Ovis ammon polii x Ovis aries TaxID=2918886 RepID=A0ACB9U8Q8_9CETA|nr:hypothetical protein MJG53_016547 [Ovis ammon polii x Ovis aries]
MGTSVTRSGGHRKGQSPCELLRGLSVFLSLRCQGLRHCVKSRSEPEDYSPVLTLILGYFWSLHRGHLKRYVCPRSLGSDHVSGDLRVAWARALGPRVDPPPARERRGPIGRARGSQESVKLDLDFDLELELDLEIEFDLELELDLDFDLDLDFELDLALELDLDFDLELDQQRETRFAQSTGGPEAGPCISPSLCDHCKDIPS